jgi:hypothetical protein
MNRSVTQDEKTCVVLHGEHLSAQRVLATDNCLDGHERVNFSLLSFAERLFLQRSALRLSDPLNAERLVSFARP